MKTLNCYIGGRKCAVAFDGDFVVLFSHSAGWSDGTRYPNMLGWKFARRFPFDAIPTLQECAAFVGAYLHLPVVVDGTPEYAEIRANIRRVHRGKRNPGEPSPAPGPAPVEPIPAPVEIPAPVPVPIPAPAPKNEIRHKEFDRILNAVKLFPVYLYGPAGSGKNHLCEQIAAALNLDFYYTNTVTQEYKLTGFVDAGGNYQETNFYRAFKNGGLFMLDEMDASCPEALICINAALANGYFEFPGIGTVHAHKDFKIIAAGNTIGTGATEQYNGRTKIDAATLDRFVPISVDYDARVENKLSGGCSDLVEFVRDLRRAAAKTGVSLVAGYRCISKSAALLGAFTDKQIVESCICGFVDSDEKRILYGALNNKENRFARCLAA